MAERTRVSVEVSTRSTFLYGFATSLDATDRTALGHTAIGNGDGVVFGANSPKPARVRKLRDTGRSVSSYISANIRNTGIPTGWKLTKRAKARVSRGGRLSKAVYVEISVGTTNVKYAWNMPNSLYTALGADRGTLGINDASNETDPYDLVWGCTPKPPRAYKVGTDGSVLSTFADPDATLPTGWAFSGGEEE